MASRNKADLYRPMIDVLDYAIMVWRMKHPTLPQPFTTCTYRKPSEQDELFAKGRTVLFEVVNGKTLKVRKVTNARAGESPHNIFPSMAFDIAFWDENKKSLDWAPSLFKMFADIVAEKYADSVTWGGNFNSIQDPPHFEWKTWKDWKGKKVA